MKLNADIVFDNLPPRLGARISGPVEQRLLLGRPVLYEGLESPFRAGTLTIVRAERLPQRAYAEPGAAIICIGSTPRIKRYQDKCRVISIDGPCDFYQLFNMVQGIYDTYDAWEADLAGIIDDDADISHMLTRSEVVLDASLLAIDKDFKVIGLSDHNSLYTASGQPRMLGTQNLDINLFDQFIGLHDLSMEQQEPFVIELLGQETLNYNLYLDGSYAGCVTVQYGTRSFRPSDKPVLEALGNQLIRAFRRLSALEADDKGTLGRAIQDLVEGYPLDAVGRELFERAASRRRFVCMRLKVSNRLANLPIGYIRNMVESAFPKSIAFEHHRNSVVAFIDLDELDHAKPYAEVIRSALEPYTQTMGMTAGISDPVADLTQARLYYLEANIALENGSLFSPNEALHTFQDHALEDMIVGALGELPLTMLCPPGLVRLIEHDDSSPTSYIETLRCYLDNNMGVAKTAAELYVHRSTLLERLARIRRELELDLDDPDVQLRLRMLLKAMEIREQGLG